MQQRFHKVGATTLEIILSVTNAMSGNPENEVSIVNDNNGFNDEVSNEDNNIDREFDEDYDDYMNNDVNGDENYNIYMNDEEYAAYDEYLWEQQFESEDYERGENGEGDEAYDEYLWEQHFHKEDYEIVENSDEDVDDEDEDDNEADDDADDDASRDDCRVQEALRKNKSIEKILKLIKRFPTEVTHQNKLGYYPLHTACECAYEIVAMKLIELFPEAAHHKTSKGLYPLHLACRSDQYLDNLDDVVMKLIGIFPEAVSGSATFGTALHLACENDGSEEVITKLGEIYPLAIEKNNKAGYYPINCAIINDQPITVTKILLDGDSFGMQRRTTGRSNNDVTPLHLAIEMQYRHDVVQYLMQRSDLQVNIRDIRGRTPLHYACKYLDDKIVGMLLIHPDVDVNAINNLSDSPVHKLLKYFMTIKKHVLLYSKN